MGHTFRTTPRYWVTNVFGPFFALLAMPFAAYFVSARFWGLAILAVPLLLPWFRNSFLLAWRDYLRLDERGLSGYLSGTEFSFEWSEILAAKLIRNSEHHYLYLGTRQRVSLLAVEPFDTDKTWSAVSAAVAPAALRDDAHLTLPYYQDWLKQREQLLSLVVTPLRVKEMSWLMHIVALAGITLFISLALFFWRDGTWMVAFLSAAIVLLMVWGVLNNGTIEMDTQTITHSTPLGRYQILWDELEWIETDRTGQALVLCGSGKRLAISGPESWSGDDEARMLQLLEIQAEQRSLEVKQTGWAAFRRSRNTRAA